MFDEIWHVIVASPCSTEKVNVRHNSAHWLVWRLKTPFSTKTGYTGDKVLGGDLVPPG